jgi:microcystin-dependent protein
MALPNRLRSARMTNATLGSSIDDEVGNLEKALCDLLGIPIDTDIAVALFAATAAGLTKITLQNASANPTAAGELQRNNTRILWHNTERAVELQPAGELKWFCGTSSPAGWLPCDGAAVSRTTYARLFATIGILFGAGDGSTTFNVPNLKGKVVVGQDAADPDFDVVGDAGGAKTVAMPSHQHDLQSHTHTQQGTFTSTTFPATVQFNTGAGTNATVSHAHDTTISGPTAGPSVNVTGAPTSSPTASVVQPYVVAAPYIST